MRRFALAFIVCFSVFVALNAIPYIVRSRSDAIYPYSRAGFPLVFWRERATGNHLRPVILGINFVVAVWVSYRIGRWWERRGTPDYMIGKKL